MASIVGFSKICGVQKIDSVIFDVGRVLFFVPLKAELSHDFWLLIIHKCVHVIKIYVDAGSELEELDRTKTSRINPNPAPPMMPNPIPGCEKLQYFVYL